MLYVVIAPRDADSGETLRSRLLKKHLGNAIGSSTLRFTLASLLWESEDWHPEIRGSKFALPADECIALTEWMMQHLLVSWASAQAPWDYEPTLIKAMQPPLNGHHNGAHPFYRSREKARDYLRMVATATRREPARERCGKR